MDGLRGRIQGTTGSPSGATGPEAVPRRAKPLTRRKSLLERLPERRLGLSHRVALRADRFERRRHELRLTEELIAERLGISTRAVRFWKSGERQPTLRELTRLAEVLCVGLGELASHLPPPKRGFFERVATVVAMGTQLAGEVFDRYALYAERIHVPFWPVAAPFVRSFDSDLSRSNQYVELKVIPKIPGPASFVFGVSVGPVEPPVLRLDYGEIRVQGQRATLRPFFAIGRNACTVARDGSFNVWTWVGPHEAKFVVHSSSDFDLVPRWPAAVGPPPGDVPHTVVFEAAPHHFTGDEEEAEQ